MRAAVGDSRLLKPVVQPGPGDNAPSDDRSGLRRVEDQAGPSGLRQPLVVDLDDLKIAGIRRVFGLTDGLRRKWDEVLRNQITFHDELIRADGRAFEELRRVERSIGALRRFGALADADLDHLWSTAEGPWDNLQKQIDVLEERIRGLVRSTQRPDDLARAQELPEILKDGVLVTRCLDQMVGDFRDLQSRLDCVITDVYRHQWLKDNVRPPEQVPQVVFAAYAEVCSSLCRVPFSREISRGFGQCADLARFHDALGEFHHHFLKTAEQYVCTLYPLPTALIRSQAPAEAVVYLTSRAADSSAQQTDRRTSAAGMMSA